MSQHCKSAPWHLRHSRARMDQRGVAILMAMLVVTLVAALSSAALWQQWRGVEVETAERSRLQSSWILQGAVDWARLILREDARTGTTDHLGEPWAVPLQEARLSTFLAAERNTSEILDTQLDAFLSGQLTDLQGRLNVINLVQAGKAFDEHGALVDPKQQQSVQRVVASVVRVAVALKGLAGA